MCRRLPISREHPRAVVKAQDIGLQELGAHTPVIKGTQKANREYISRILKCEGSQAYMRREHHRGINPTTHEGDEDVVRESEEDDD